MTDNDIGANIEALRRSRGWSRERLAEVSGIEIHALSNYARGATTLPLTSAHRIAVALAVDLTRLVTGVVPDGARRTPDSVAAAALTVGLTRSAGPLPAAAAEESSLDDAAAARDGADSAPPYAATLERLSEAAADRVAATLTRDALICKATRQGAPIASIASRTSLTDTDIRRIVSEGGS